jgi:CheY-like chemotaxis protein
MALDILIVDDEKDIRDLVSGVLEDEGFSTRTAANSQEALQALAERRPSLALLDVWLQGSKLDGLQLLEEIGGASDAAGADHLGHGNLDTAVAAIRRRGGLHRKAVRGEHPSISSPARPRPSGCARMRRCACRWATRWSSPGRARRSTMSARR